MVREAALLQVDERECHRHEAGLHVTGTAAVETVAINGGAERRVLPLAEVPGVDDVLVAAEREHGAALAEFGD